MRARARIFGVGWVVERMAFYASYQFIYTKKFMRNVHELT